MNHVKFKHGASATMGAYGCANAYHLLQFLAASNDDVVKACTMTEAELRAHTDNSIPLPNSFAAWGTRCAYSQARGAESLFISSVFRDPLARPNEEDADARTAKYFAAIEAEKAEAEAYVENAQRYERRAAADAEPLEPLEFTLWRGDSSEMCVVPVNSVEIIISGGSQAERDICMSWARERQSAMLAAAYSNLAGIRSASAIIDFFSYFEARKELWAIADAIVNPFDKQVVMFIDPQLFSNALEAEKGEPVAAGAMRQVARDAAKDMAKVVRDLLRYVEQVDSGRVRQGD